jgi:hypothetical protein
MAKQSGPGRGQLRKRGARTWRDVTNPTGPGHGPGEPEPVAESAEELPGEGEDHPTDEQQHHAELVEGGPTAGPGGGGATQSSDRAKHFEGQHGSQTRKA